MPMPVKTKLQQAFIRSKWPKLPRFTVSSKLKQIEGWNQNYVVPLLISSNFHEGQKIRGPIG